MNKYVVVLSAAVLGLALTACGNAGQESAPAAAPAASTKMAAPMAAPATSTAMKAPAASTHKPASTTPPQN